MLNFVYRSIILIVTFSFNAFLTKAQTEYLVTVNPNTGIPTKIDSIPGLKWIQSYSTYNETTKEYSFLGTWEPGLSPTFLYTLDAVTGSIISKPVVPNYNKIISLQYSRLTGILYGIVNQSGVYYLVTINKTSGTYSIIHDIPGIDGVGQFIIDEANQRLFLSAVDNNPGFALWTIDLVTGNIIYHVSTKAISDLRYDHVTHKIYALTSRPGPTPSSSYIISICTVEPATGVTSVIADLPGVTGIVSGYGTFNENDHLYLFTAIEQHPPVLLYSVDVNTGNIITKAPISTSGVIENDNLIFFRYDNISKKLYGLFWEAKTIRVSPGVIDSNCRIDLKTRIYPNPTSSILNIDKNPTKCKVVINIFNMIGQSMIKGKSINDGHNEIQMSNLPQGIYYYEFISNREVLLSGRFLKK